MTLQIRSISAKDIQTFWETFPGVKTFLQGEKFAIFREKIGEKNFRLGSFYGEKLIGTLQCQKIVARRGTFLHVAHGPLIMSAHIDESLPALLKELKKLGKKEHCDFIRVSPLLPELTEEVFRKSNFIPAPLHINPDRTWVLNLEQDEDELLKNMRKSTRYEVRKGEKSGIKLCQGNTTDDLKNFWELHEQTAARQKFVPFSKKSTEIEMKVFGNDCQIFTAQHDRKNIASSVILFDSHSGYYHQGASVLSKIPGAHATLWAAIKEAKLRGCKEFNFWGVSPSEKPDHPWAGLSRFKRGFGGDERKYLRAQDLPLTTKYWLNFAIEKFRRWKRHY
jgi:peptidoglycan pentaglycine glycine transferase (the first glycine)